MAKKAKTKKKASKKRSVSGTKRPAKSKKPQTWEPKPVEGIGWPAFRYPLPS